ncbi:uncharacterized protein FA14DRAFT_169978 [Meira miltonrushii]|uniref:DNA replication factor Cdt1 C-terminal domain-containing protein n=1 Tax=Meira miltonrushii TaxID=1280837 RepID=A0A316VHH3_9BASI|nr:uncharacterized protein FA14DRAFT_169978 [Meira miltonrushii]PWN37089.1 hypothetical protein FA14DRAFT_169978 [Meira miltonrushii]
MVSNTRKPPLRQPLRSHFRTQKAGGTGQLNSIKETTKVSKGKAKEESITTINEEPQRPSTPPPRTKPSTQGSCSSSISDPPGAFFTPRTPPRTPKPRSRTSTLPDVALLDPVQRSPISVRTDPDNGKLFLLLPSSPSSKIVSTPPSRRLFADELSSEERVASTSKSNEELQPALKRAKRSFPEPEEEEYLNPFIGGFYASPRTERTTQASFINPSTSSDIQLSASKSLPFPAHHATLIALHSAVEYALVVHLASVGTAGSTIENDSKSIAIPHLISFSVLRPLVERSSGRKFSKNELARLLWIWGAAPANETNSTAVSQIQKNNIGFTISKARIRSLDWMLGIRISANATTNREVNLIALWNNGGEDRKRIVRERMMDWCLRCLSTWRTQQQGGGSEDTLHGLGILPDAPPPSKASEPAQPADGEVVAEWDAGFPLDRIAPIPLAQMPSLEVNSIPSSPSLGTSSPKSPRKTRLDLVREAHQTVIAQNEEKLGRKLTLKERIRAKEQANAVAGQKRSRDDENDSPLSSSSFSTSASSAAACARQKASLSRLQDVAESVYMLFVSTSGSGSGSTRFSPHPLQDVIKAITNASKQAMGFNEAKAALHQLSSIAPGFIEVERIGMRDWVKFVGNSEPNRTTLASVRQSIKTEMERRYS